MTEPSAGSLGSRVLGELQATDLAVYLAIAHTTTPTLDVAMKRLSRAADHSVLWLSIAGALAVVPGAPRRAAVLGVASIGVASATTNLVAKTVLPRARPDRKTAAVPAARQVRMPTSTSFPSGHAASAFAFASAVGEQAPALSLPIELLATAVAYSRVHTGVHYPGDTIVGASIGAASAALTTQLAQRYRPHGRFGDWTA
jgi:undecaprenyl-diphosphatase